jgi:hypothetical protein
MHENDVTQTGAPCYSVSQIIDVDLQEGKPLPPSQAAALVQAGKDAWRISRVLTHKVEPSRTGFGEGGARPFHQDYRFYKYYGFAGKGAKTSWASNPKLAECVRAVACVMALHSICGRHMRAGDALAAMLTARSSWRQTSPATTKRPTSAPLAFSSTREGDTSQLSLTKAQATLVQQFT